MVCFFRVVHSVSDIDNLRSDDTSMTYTSRRNCGFIKVESAGSDHKADTSQVSLLNEQTDDTSIGRIIIKSPDTDDLVLCVHYFSKLQHTQELWFQTGTFSSTKDRRRYIPVHEICSLLVPFSPISYQLLML